MPAPDYAIASLQHTINPKVAVWNETSAPPLTITYSFETEQSLEFLKTYTGWSPWSEAQKAAVRAALAEYASVLNVQFVELPAGPADPNIAFGRIDLNWGGESYWKYGFNTDAAGNVTFKRNDAGVVFDNERDLTTVAARWLIIHEIGHAMMNKHTGDYDVTGTQTPGPFLPAAEDNNQYSMMSYNPPPDGAAAGQLQLYDIAALQARWGANLATGAGDDTYSFDDDVGIFAIWDAGGTDRIDAGAAGAAVGIDLNEGGFSTLGPQRRISIAYGVTIEDAAGGAFGDTITGNAGSNRLTGNGGDDLLIGGGGADEALYSGEVASYRVSADGVGFSVLDLRGGAPDGQDAVRGIEALRFADGLVALGDAAVSFGVQNILRAGLVGGAGAAAALDLTAKIAGGALTLGQALGEIVKAADSTTSVATLAYQFFTGKIPSLGGIDYLVAESGPNPNNLNSAYYQTFNLENRYINFAVNLGKEGEGKATFLASYGALTLAEATKQAYDAIFGGAPSDAKVAELLGGGRDLYFAGYGGDGLSGQGTKAAMVGWLLAEAAKADLGMYARANDAFLLDLADGANFAVDLIGVYGKAEFNYGGA